MTDRYPTIVRTPDGHAYETFGYHFWEWERLRAEVARHFLPFPMTEEARKQLRDKTAQEGTP